MTRIPRDVSKDTVLHRITDALRERISINSGVKAVFGSH